MVPRESRSRSAWRRTIVAPRRAIVARSLLCLAGLPAAALLSADFDVELHCFAMVIANAVLHRWHFQERKVNSATHRRFLNVTGTAGRTVEGRRLELRRLQMVRAGAGFRYHTPPLCALAGAQKSSLEKPLERLPALVTRATPPGAATGFRYTPCGSSNTRVWSSRLSSYPALDSSHAPPLTTDVAPPL